MARFNGDPVQTNQTGTRFSGVPAAPAQDPTPVEDEAVNKSSVGRVLDAFGQGFKEGWGAEALGLSRETEEALTSMGVLNDVRDKNYNIMKGFNSAIIRPLAWAMDAGFRTFEGGLYSLGRGAQAVEDEIKGGHTSNKTFREIVNLGNYLGVTHTGDFPAMRLGKKVRRPRSSSAWNDFDQSRTRAQAAREPGPGDPGFKAPPSGDVPDILRPTSEFSENAGKTGPTGSKAGNINLDRIQAPEDIKEMLQKVSAAHGDFSEARRGTMSLNETESLAHSLGMTPEELMKRKVGQAFNAEEAVAARNLLVHSAENVKERALATVDGGEDALLKFQETMTRHIAIQEQVSGLTAEAGRALSAFRIMAKGKGEIADLSRTLEDFGGAESIREMAMRITQLDTPQKVSRFALEARKATTGDMITEAWINGLLSGPKTHLTNIISNTAVALWKIPETVVAAGISKFRNVDELNRVYFGEAGARSFGIIQGAREGIRAGWKAWKTETPTRGGQRIELGRYRAIPSKKVTVPRKGSKEPIELEIGGRQVRIPGRALLAEDEFFKAIGYRQELNALAYRKAAADGLRGDALRRRIVDLVENPTKAMRDSATKNADYQTFTKELGKPGRSMVQFSNSHPAMKFIIPFIRTPINILKYAGERTPLSLFSKEVRKVLKGENGAAAQTEQWARLLMGSSVGTAVFSLAADGLITGGGPTNSQERAVWYLNGNQPYSVRIGDMMYSYQRIEPLGFLLGTAADAQEVSDRMGKLESEEIAALVTASVSKNLVSKTWLQGPADLIEAIQDPERYGARYVNKMIGTLVPTGVAQVAQAEDPYLRDARSMTDTIRSRVPGQSSMVIPRYDIWGQPIKKGGALGSNLLSPIYENQISEDPVNQELQSLEVWPAKPRRQLRGVDLDEEQYETYQVTSGRLAKNLLDQMVSTDGWYELPEFARRNAIERVITTSRQQGQARLMMEYPELLKKIVKNRVEMMGGDLNSVDPNGNLKVQDE